MNFIFLYITFFFSFLFFLIIPLSFQKINSPILTKFYNNISSIEKKNVTYKNSSSHSANHSQYIFHTPYKNYSSLVSNQYYYKVYIVNQNGNLVKKTTLPNANQQNTLLTGDIENNFFKKFNYNHKQYLTYPLSGDYFILYPKAGSDIYIFNKEFQYIFHKKLNYYLKAFYTGDYIMGIAGDLSRLSFLRQNLEEIFYLDVNLLVHHQISETSNFACFSSLSGEAIFVNLDTQITIRNKNNFILKSISCDFSNGIFALHLLERIEKQFLNKHDSIIIGKIPTKNLTQGREKIEFLPIKPIMQYNMDKIYPYTIPIIIHKNILFYISYNQNRVYANIANYKKKKEPFTIDITDLLDSSEIDTMQTFVYQDKFILYSDYSLLIFNKSGLIDYFQTSQNILKSEVVHNSIFIQTTNTIMALKTL